MNTIGMNAGFPSEFNYQSPFTLLEPRESEEEFYNGAINFQALCDAIKGANGKTFVYNYKDYISNDFSKYVNRGGEYKIPKNRKLKVTDGMGNAKEVILFGRLNKKQGYVRLRGSSDVCNSINVSIDNKVVNYQKFFYFDGTPACSNNEEDMAFEISSYNTVDFLQLSEYIGYYSDKSIKGAYNEAFVSAKGEASALDFLYANARSYVCAERTDAVLWRDLKTLLIYDAISWIDDASNSMVNVLSGFSNLQDMYTALEKDPFLVLALYDYINGTQAEKYCTFLDILSKIYASTERRATMYIKIPHGKGYEMDSDLFFDATTGTINIRVYKQSTKPQNPPSGMLAGTSIPGSKINYTTVVDEPNLHPLDIVQLYNVETNEVQLVPAIYAKLLSDKVEWAGIVEAITIALDIISILISVGTIAAGARGLLFLISLADIGLAATDLALKIDGVRDLLNKTEARKWLVDNWPQISGFGGAMLLSPLIINGILKNGPRIIRFLSKELTKQAFEFADFIKRLILNIKVELYILAYNRVVLCTFEPFTIVAQLFGNTIAKRMEGIGLFLGKASEGEIRLLLFEGVKIAEGHIKSLKKVVAEIFQRKGDDLIRYWQQLTFFKRLGELRKPAGSINKGEDILLTTIEGLQSSKKEKFKSIILGYHRDANTKYLWTIDDRGINLALEKTPTPRLHIVHTNLSSKAYIGGEAWFISENKVVLNAGSGRFGDRAGASLEQFDAATGFWQSLGYEIEVIPLGLR